MQQPSQTGSSKTSTTSWTLADLVRFEQCRLQDQQSAADEVSLAARDRAVFKEAPSPTSRSRVYRFWLSKQLQQRQLAPDSGEILEQSSSTTALVLLLVGVLSGVGVASSAMFYDGSVPVNVALFLALLVLPQLLLLVGLLISIGLAAIGQNPFARWYQPLATLLQVLWRKLWKVSARHLSDSSAEGRDDAAIRAALLQEMVQRHKPLMFNRIMRLFQTLGIGFNLGALLCVLVLLAVTDRAFGWQSSLTSSAATVHQLISTAALPWSWWLGEGVGFPSLQQVIDTRIQLGVESAGFAADEYRVWWPFMLLSVLVYGLLPRLLVWGWCQIQERRWLAQLSFDGYHDQALWRRMQSVELSSHSQPSDHSSEQQHAHTPVVSIAASLDEDASRLLVLEETLQRYPAAKLEQWLESVSGHSLELESLKTLSIKESGDRSVKPLWLVLEGWQPPIEETMQQLRSIANQLAQADQSLHLVLLGKPLRASAAEENSTITVVSKPLTPRLADVWRKKLDLLQCANILVHIDDGVEA